MAEWYYAQHEEQFGPVTAAALKEMAQAGKLAREDLIWREGMQRWAPAHKVRGLFESEDDAESSGTKAKRNGKQATTDKKRDPETDVVPASDVDVSDDIASEDSAAEDDADYESDSGSGDKETAIDVLPLAGPEESKLHVPNLATPGGAPDSARSQSDEIVVFEPASVTPPPPMHKREAPAQDSSVERQTRIDVPAREGGNSLVSLGMFLQTFTWVTCLLVILAGGVVYLGALMMRTDSSDRLAASGIYATFVLASYFLARSTERICRACGWWFGISSDRTSQRNVRQRNWQRFQ